MASAASPAPRANAAGSSALGLLSREGGKDRSQGGSRTAGNLLLNDPLRGDFRRAHSRAVRHRRSCTSRPRRATGRNDFGDLLDDLAKRAGAVDVFENAASAALEVGQRGGFLADPAFQDPAPDATAMTTASSRPRSAWLATFSQEGRATTGYRRTMRMRMSKGASPLKD